MTVEQLIENCKKQQELTGRSNATVTLWLPGKWSDKGKRLLPRDPRSPVGQCVAEEKGRVLCAFEADKILLYIATAKE